MDDVQRDLGRHEARIDALTSEVHRLAEQVAEMNATLSEARGGWKTLMAVAGVAGAAGSLLTKFSGYIFR